MIQCNPGGLFKYGLSQIDGSNRSIPLFSFNSNATRATVASSKSLKGKLPSETNAIPQAMVQKRKIHKIGGLQLWEMLSFNIKTLFHLFISLKGQ